LPYEASAADTEHIDALEREIRVLRNLEAARIQFLTLVSHELRTPLTSILTYAEALEDQRLGPLGDDQLEALASVARAARQTLEMVDEILRYSKSGGQSAELCPECFDLEAMIEQLESSHQSLLARKSLEFRKAIDVEAPRVYADRAKVSHVLANLISNAIEFTPDGGSIEVSARPDEEGAWMRVEVSDTGIGISPEDQDRIFEEFVSLDRGVDRRLGGSGLGLSIARRLIEMHGGELGLESAPGEGSRFHFTLPTEHNRSALALPGDRNRSRGAAGS
jgi:two-component system, NarL family, sensor histidine kinase BarA